MTNRREPADARTAPQAATTSTTHHQPNNGHQPLPLDNRSSIWATKRSSGSGPICGTAHDRIRPNARQDPGPPRARSGRAGAPRVALSLAAASPRTAEASIRLGVTLATERDEPRRPTRQRLPFCPGDEHSGGADGQVRSAVSISQGSRACKQKRSSVDVVDETAPSGSGSLPFPSVGALLNATGDTSGRGPPPRRCLCACTLGPPLTPASLSATSASRANARTPALTTGCSAVPTPASRRRPPPRAASLRSRYRPNASARILVRRVPAPNEQQALQKRPFALASLSQRNARSHADPRSNGCRSARAIGTLAPPTGPLSSTVSQVHAGCKHRSSSVGAVDQTAGTGARQRRGPGDQAACSQCREHAPSKRPDYYSPIGGEASSLSPASLPLRNGCGHPQSPNVRFRIVANWAVSI